MAVSPRVAIDSAISENTATSKKNDRPMGIPSRAMSHSRRGCGACMRRGNSGRNAAERAISTANAADRILRSAGSAGTNLAYLENTVRHLDELGIAEGPLHDLLQLTAKRRPRAADHG